MLNEFPIFDYEDIQLIPNKCVIKSRAEADTSVILGNQTFKFLWYNKNKQKYINYNSTKKIKYDHYFFDILDYYEEPEFLDFKYIVRLENTTYIFWQED